jgi:biopolymer transport protein ExbD
MHMRGLNLGHSGADELIARRSEDEMPEFDITAMVDLVFLMNLYFLVTFITIAMGEMSLPAADHASPLDADTAVVLSLARSLDGESVTVFLGDGEKGEAITDIAQQAERVQAAIEEGVAAGKKAVLLKAESKVRLADLFRISSLLAGQDLQLHVAVLERDNKQ